MSVVLILAARLACADASKLGTSPVTVRSSSTRVAGVLTMVSPIARGETGG